MKRTEKEVTFLSLVIRHNQGRSRASLSGFGGSGENTAQNINRAADGIREFEEHEQAYCFSR